MFWQNLGSGAPPLAPVAGIEMDGRLVFGVRQTRRESLVFVVAMPEIGWDWKSSRDTRIGSHPSNHREFASGALECD